MYLVKLLFLEVFKFCLTYICEQLGVQQLRVRVQLNWNFWLEKKFIK